MEPVLEPIRVLLVEDDPDDVELIREQLERAQHQALTLTRAPRLDEGLQRLATGKVDAVLLDLSLPDSQGIDTFLAVRKQAQEVPVIILSGLNDESLALEAIHQGAQDYLVKRQTDGRSMFRAVRYAVERDHLQKMLTQHMQDVLRLKEDFLPTVSHELRTPLAIIKEAVRQVVKGTAGPLTDPQQNLLAMAQTHIDRLARLINDLLDMSKLGAGKLTLVRSRVDLSALARQLATTFQLKVQEKGLRLTVHAPAVSVEVYADVDRLTQILMNLINNAIRFTEQGGIDVTLGVDGLMVSCTITDTGGGDCSNRSAASLREIPTVSPSAGWQRRPRDRAGVGHHQGTGRVAPRHDHGG